MTQVLNYSTPQLPPRSRRYFQRSLLFLLSATSIWCLLVDFYKWMPTRTFTLWVFLPAAGIIAAWAIFDRVERGGDVWRIVWIGMLAGLAGAIAYDIFRLPFVFAREWGISSIVPPLPLFKVFPQFGRMIVGDLRESASYYSWSDHVVGWVYHFSNGITFGIMYLSLLGNPQRRSWVWGIAMAVGIEICMLLTPYTAAFGIKMSPTFVTVTLSAHMIFGAVMGLTARRWWPGVEGAV